LKEEIHHRDAPEFAFPRKITTGKAPNWKQRLMGSLVKGVDGKYRPAPEKEKDIEAFTATYGRIKKLWRIRVPDALLRAIFGRGQLLDRLVETSHPKLREGYRLEAKILRARTKMDLADKPDDTFIDPERLPDGTHRALVIENKTKAGTLSKGQRKTKERLGGMHVTRSKDEVKAAIDAFCDHQPIPGTQPKEPRP
jgi:hypothetical protein